MDSINKPATCDFSAYADDDSDLYGDNEAPLKSSIERHENDVGIQSIPDYSANYSIPLCQRKSVPSQTVTALTSHSIVPASIEATEHYLDSVLKGEVPVISPNLIALNKSGYQKEVKEFNTFTSSLGIWALVDQKWTQELASWIHDRECLEVMAGNGLLAKALTQKGVSILATDDKSWDDPDGEFIAFHEVERFDALRAINKFRHKDILIMSWPPPNVAISIDVLKAWGSDKPIVFIGDKAGGMTACDEFYNHFVPSIQQPIKSYMSSHGAWDNVTIGYYKP